MKKTPADQAAEQQALRQRWNTAWQAARDAEKAGDEAAGQAQDSQYRTLRDQADAIDARHIASVRPQLDELESRIRGIDMVGQKVEVLMWMNEQRLPPAGGTGLSAALAPPAPAEARGCHVSRGAIAQWQDGPRSGPRRGRWLESLARSARTLSCAPRHETHQPSARCSGKYTAMPPTMVSSTLCRQK